MFKSPVQIVDLNAGEQGNAIFLKVMQEFSV